MKLVLGCYDERPHPFHYRWIDDTWVLSDINPRTPNIKNVDARDIPYKELDAIYASHVVEHIKPEFLTAMFKHWYDTLKTGGQVIINVPDMKWIANEFVSGKITSPYFYSENRLMEAIYGSLGQTEYDKHKWGFTENTLREYLEKAGFRNIKIVKEYEAHEMGCLIAEAIK